MQSLVFYWCVKALIKVHLYKIWISVSAFTKTYKTTKIVLNTYNSECETKLCGIII